MDSARFLRFSISGFSASFIYVILLHGPVWIIHERVIGCAPSVKSGAFATLAV